MVCMYDGNVYNFTQKGFETLNREELFLHFRDGHESDIFAMYDADNHYVGAITYHSLISSQDLSGAVMKDKLILEEGFWEKAYELLSGHNYKVIPVFNQNMDILYLARYESRLEAIWQKFDILMSLGMQAGLWVSSTHSGKHFHITGCNMILYYFRQWLLSQGAEVSVSGEQWNFFGIQEQELCDSEAILVDENCGEIEFLHDEYMQGMGKELNNLKEVLDKEFIGDITAEDKIMFWLPSVSGIFSSYNIISLIHKYLHQSGKTCMVIMPTQKDLIHRGAHWLKVAIKFMREIQESGGNICLWDEVEKMCQGRYSVCYTPMAVDVLRIPLEVRDKTDTMVIVQSLAFFTHYYWKSDTYCTFEGEFTEEARNATDYYVASDFIADWICQQDPRWSDKMLRFGYPKQDLLYNYMHGEKDIPKDWLEKTEGKKVFLFTELKESWLGRLLKEDNQVIILRPHPDWLNIYGEVLRKLVELSKGKLILDDRASYNASFYLADAMITEPLCSIGVVFLSMGKPMLLRNDVVDESNVKIDFRKEDWYQAAYIGESDDDVFEFMDMVRKGEDVKKQELEEYRSRMVKDFDGKVCERIYNYFEELYKK
ncbi:MAG: hypothetical protein HFI74_06345 [Lachnospiraceae bacterium]|jgi:hypothetical protein|nr:hypothetical protein [Lachnospiraceae bacterium]